MSQINQHWLYSDREKLDQLLHRKELITSAWSVEAKLMRVRKEGRRINIPEIFVGMNLRRRPKHVQQEAAGGHMPLHDV